MIADRKRKKIVIWGASGHAWVVANTAEISGLFEVVGFLDDVNPTQRSTLFSGKVVLGGREALENIRQAGVVDIALGFGDCDARLQMGASLRENGYSVVTILHPSSIIAPHVTIGDGTVVLAGVTIDPYCKIGKYCIINNNSVISHQSEIEDGVHICPGVNLAGNIHIGRGAWIGIGTTVIEKISIGEGSFVGAGSTVVTDIPRGVLVFGSPARIIRKI
jgi:sugar O-acyltransferase (sialic acid O-acetyltransferase NeuD family)